MLYRKQSANRFANLFVDVEWEYLEVPLRNVNLMYVLIPHAHTVM